jgi:single-strand DNA-binding protein
MSTTVNRVILLGTLGADPEVRDVAGKKFASLRIATNYSWKTASGERKEETTWHRIETSGMTAENCGKYLAKGRQVYVEGRIRTREYEKDGVKRYITEVVADNIKFMPGGQRSTEAPSAPTKARPSAAATEEMVDDMDSPF